MIQRRLYSDKTPWPFHLIAKCEAVQSEDGPFRKYWPCSDFLISKSKLPRLLVEVNLTSTPNNEYPPDFIRMLLVGAAVVRFANKFLDAFLKEKNFVLCALFIYDSGHVNCFTLFQKRNDPAVCRVLYTNELGG